MYGDDYEEHISLRDLKKFALGNTILFFGCMVYPLGEGLVSICCYFKLLGPHSDINCMVLVDKDVPISYNPNNDDYTKLSKNDFVTDVS